MSAEAPVFDPRAYWEERLGGACTLAGVGYAGLGLPFNRWMYRVRRSVFLREMRRRLPRDRPIDVLDVGSGTGFYVERWRELGVRSIRGSDLTEAAVGHLRERHPGLPFVRLDIGARLDDPAAAGGPYDAISAFDVLFHIVDDDAFRRAFHNVWSLLRPGGLFVFSENFVHGPTQRLRHHVSRSAAEVEAAARAAGFSIERRLPMFVLMNQPVDARTELLRRWWRWLEARLRSDPASGRRLGAVLCPLELALTRVLREGPSSEMMVCRRPPTPPLALRRRRR